MSHQAPTSSDTDDKVPEVPEAFEEDEGDDSVKEKDNENGVDESFIETFNSIQLQSQDNKTLPQKISSAIDMLLS
jgi:hypothetical protein